jgi:hypothetical protein
MDYCPESIVNIKKRMVGTADHTAMIRTDSRSELMRPDKFSRLQNKDWFSGAGDGRG